MRTIQQDFKLALMFIVIIVLQTGCASVGKKYSHTNTAIPEPDAGIPASRATYKITTDRGRDDTLMILALSGGGSRAAYLSASVMLKLQEVFAADNINLLHEIDAISSVSGGSLPAAYYTISNDPGTAELHGRIWDRPTVTELMSRNYIRRWLADWMWPQNVVKFWFTAFDRSDIMAQTIANNLLDTSPYGNDLKFADLNPERPYLILNATNGTSNDNLFGSPFRFTTEEFAGLKSNINDYSLARGVMATATFPAVFNFMTLKNYAVTDREEYVHVFDGGNFDNLGLNSVLAVLNTTPLDDVDKIVVVLVDAYTGKSGVDSQSADTRSPSDFIIDSNFFDATSSLLSANRINILAGFKQFFTNLTDGIITTPDNAIFYHVKLDDILDDDLRDKLVDISTNFKISSEDTQYIDTAMDQLFTPDNQCLQAIKALAVGESHSIDPICTYQR